MICKKWIFSTFASVFSAILSLSQALTNTLLSLRKKLGIRHFSPISIRYQCTLGLCSHCAAFRTVYIRTNISCPKEAPIQAENITLIHQASHWTKAQRSASHQYSVKHVEGRFTSCRVWEKTAIQSGWERFLWVLGYTQAAQCGHQLL